MSKILASKYITNFLVSQGVKHIFELTGGMVSHLLDAIHLDSRIKLISVHHEQAAGFAADAYSRQKNVPGIAIGTSGPGAINLLTGLGNCFYDSVPAIFITGQVNTYERKGDKKIRQLGFQENDIVPMAAPVCKKAIAIENLEDIPAVFEEAFRIALGGRPGPVLIDLPMDFQRSEITSPEIKPVTYGTEDASPGVKQEDISSLQSAIEQAERPIILAGRGIKAANALEEFKEFLSVTGIPVTTSLLGLDVISYDDPLRVGFIGVYGNRWANNAIYRSDLIIALGSRLDIRQTGADLDAFTHEKRIFHIDIDAAELTGRLNTSVGIHAHLKAFLGQFNAQAGGIRKIDYSSWMNWISDFRQRHPDTGELKLQKGINPNVFLHLLSAHSSEAVSYISDVGNHQMWCAQSLELRSHQSFHTSGGMGAMGYALPAAMGAAFAEESKPVVAISGDGGFQINIQELQTIVHHSIPVKMVIFNNQSLGMIRQFQDSYFDNRHVSSAIGYSAPDFAKIAGAYGIDAMTINDPEEMESAVQQLWEKPGKPFLLQVQIDPEVNAYPKIAFGSPIHIMEPLINDE